MTDTPAVMALRQRREILMKSITKDASQAAHHRHQLEQLERIVAHAEAAVVDIDKAIKALSYPDNP